jgi:hypothetical protein
MLHAQPASGAGEPHHVELATTLVIRGSTARPPASTIDGRSAAAGG